MTKTTHVGEIRFRGHQSGWRGNPTPDEDYVLWMQINDNPYKGQVATFNAARIYEDGKRGSLTATYTDGQLTRLRNHLTGYSKGFYLFDNRPLVYVADEVAQTLLIWIDSMLLGL